MVAVVICAHPTRRHHVETVLAPARNDPLIVWDDSSYGSNLNHARAWRLAAQQDSEWVGVIEDDAVPVVGCLKNLPVMLSHSPSKLVSAYLGQGRPAKYQGSIQAVLASDPQWVIANDLLHHVAVFTTPQYAGKFADLLDTSTWPCDSAIGFLARQHRQPIAYSVPSLFDHSDPEPLITDRQVSDTSRTAWRTGTRDWTTGDIAYLNQQSENMYRHLYDF